MNLFSEINDTNNSVALVDEDGCVITYSELYKKQKDISRYFEKRSLALFLCNNSFTSITIYLSLLEAKCIPILVDSNLSHDLVTRLIKLYNPDYLIHLNDRNIINENYHSFKSISEFNVQKIESSSFKIENADLGLLLSTSGSTGSPKLVRITYNNVFANTKSICEYLEIDKHDRAITSLPMSYSFGLSVIHTHLYVGASILVSTRSVVEKEFWNSVVGKQVTFLSGVPFTYELLEKIKFRSKDFKSLKYLVQAGGKLNPNLIELFARDSVGKNRKFFVMYGQTEATARMSYLHYTKCLEKIGSIGIAIPGGSFKLVDDNGIEINEPNIAGELVYSGPNVSQGYAESRKDLNLGDENCGVLFTGDLATRDNDGFFYIVGRKKRFIKLFGNRFNLDEIEQLLKSNFSLDCACVGSDDSLQIFTTENVVDKNHIKKELASKLKLHPSIIYIKIIEEIPKNSSGKINYPLLK